MEKWQEYVKVIGVILKNKEPCQSGLTYDFAKVAEALKPLGSSNLPGSAVINFNIYDIV